MREKFYFLILLAGFAFAASASAQAEPTPAKRAMHIGLTPVILDDQAAFLNSWRAYLERHLGRPVIFTQRGTYREVMELLREGKLDFAWLCGYPYVRNKDQFRLVAVPIYHGEPLYHSYLIVPASDKKTQSLAGLSGKVFAFSDPDSNSGYLYPEYLLSQKNMTSASFFYRSFFTWSHREVVEAVAAGLADGGAVDSYVWDTLSKTHPELTSKTRVVSESPQFAFPPIIASLSVSMSDLKAFQTVLFSMEANDEGASLLDKLNLNGFIHGNAELYANIADMSRFVERKRINAASQGH